MLLLMDESWHERVIGQFRNFQSRSITRTRESLHSRQDIASVLNQLIKVSILPTLLVLFLEKHLQQQTPQADASGLKCIQFAIFLGRFTSRCCSSVKVCIYSSKYF